MGSRAVYTTHTLVDYLPQDVVSLRIRHESVSDTSPPEAEYGWTFTSWIAALSAAPTSLKLGDSFLDEVKMVIQGSVSVQLTSRHEKNGFSVGPYSCEVIWVEC
jgi:hypothetical protein